MICGFTRSVPLYNRLCCNNSYVQPSHLIKPSCSHRDISSVDAKHKKWSLESFIQDCRAPLLGQLCSFASHGTRIRSQFDKFTTKFHPQSINCKIILIPKHFYRSKTGNLTRPCLYEMIDSLNMHIYKKSIVTLKFAK